MEAPGGLEVADLEVHVGESELYGWASHRAPRSGVLDLKGAGSRSKAPLASGGLGSRLPRSAVIGRRATLAPRYPFPSVVGSAFGSGPGFGDLS